MHVYRTNIHELLATCFLYPPQSLRASLKLSTRWSASLPLHTLLRHRPVLCLQVSRTLCLYVAGGVHLLTESIAPPTDIVGNMRSFASARPSSHWSHSLTIYLSSTCKLLSWYVLASRLERAPSPKSSFTRFKSSTPPHPIGYPRLPGAPLSNAPNSAIPSSLYIWRDHDQRLGAYCALQLSHDHAASLRLYRPLLRSGMGSRARSSGGIRSCFWISFPAAPPRCSIPYCY